MIDDNEVDDDSPTLRMENPLLAGERPTLPEFPAVKEVVDDNV